MLGRCPNKKHGRQPEIFRFRILTLKFLHYESGVVGGLVGPPSPVGSRHDGDIDCFSTRRARLSYGHIPGRRLDKSSSESPLWRVGHSHRMFPRNGSLDQGLYRKVCYLRWGEFSFDK